MDCRRTQVSRRRFRRRLRTIWRVKQMEDMGFLGISMAKWRIYALPLQVPSSISAFICSSTQQGNIFGGFSISYCSSELAVCPSSKFRLGRIPSPIGSGIVDKACATPQDSKIYFLGWVSVLQKGQVECERNHMSIQSTWKLCLQLGRIRAVSFSCNSHRHIEHSNRSVKLCDRYTNLGSVSNTAESNPIFCRLSGSSLVK